MKIKFNILRARWTKRRVASRLTAHVSSLLRNATLVTACFWQIAFCQPLQQKHTVGKANRLILRDMLCTQVVHFTVHFQKKTHAWHSSRNICYRSANKKKQLPLQPNIMPCVNILNVNHWSNHSFSIYSFTIMWKIHANATPVKYSLCSHDHIQAIVITYLKKTSIQKQQFTFPGHGDDVMDEMLILM